MKIELHRKNIHTGNLILVNADYPYNEQVNETDLVNVDKSACDVLLERRAVTLLSKLMEEINGWDQISAVSGWRSMQEQENIYAQSLKENGSEFTQKYVALPGHSEHQTGLAIDLALTSDNIDFIRPDFPYTGICQTFRELSSQYGFIERYPQKKESITGIAHEPWHFRYIGVPHAEIMKKNDLCMEEYIPFIKQFAYGEQKYNFTVAQKNFSVSYLPASEAEIVCIEIAEDVSYTISRNNIDGYIITEWR